MAINRGALLRGHRYQQGSINCFCPKCSEQASAREGRSIIALGCKYDDDPAV